MSTQRIGDFEFQLNRNGRPYQAIAYFCHLSNERLSECQNGRCRHDATITPGVEQSMVNWYNNAFAQMQDRIVVAQRLNETS